MDELTGPDSRTLYRHPREGKRGAKGSFNVVYTDETADTRWGFFCTNCESLDTAVDAMGRVQCNQCSNRTKAEEWDAAHE